MHHFNRFPRWQPSFVSNGPDNHVQSNSNSSFPINSRPRPLMPQYEQRMNLNESQKLPLQNRFPERRTDFQMQKDFASSNQYAPQQRKGPHENINQQKHGTFDTNASHAAGFVPEFAAQKRLEPNIMARNQPANMHVYSSIASMPHAAPQQHRFSLNQIPRNFSPMHFPVVPPAIPWQSPMPIPNMPFLNEPKRESRNLPETCKNDGDIKIIQEWLQHRNIKKLKHKTTSDETNAKLSDAKLLINEFLEGIEELTICKDFLCQNIKVDESDWLQIAGKSISIKEHLEKLQSALFRKDYIAKLINTQKKRQKKRERQGKLRRTKAKQRTERLRNAVVWDQQIDEWRHKILSDINAKKLADSLKSEAGKSLVEVRKKKSESSKYLEKLTAIRELRKIRRETALQRGIFIFGKEDEKFEKRVEALLSLTKSRIDNYKDEEKTLLVMLEEEKEQIQREDDKKRKRLMKNEHLRLFGYDPLLESCRYWLQAEENTIALVQVRRLWDVHIVPDTMLGADRVPEGWVIPEPGKNSQWNKYLHKKKTDVL